MLKLIKKQDGFTLLELLIVIVIIGILAVLIIPNLASGPQRARDAQRKSDLRNVKTALETYYNDNNAYPTGNFGALSAALTPNYMKTVPTDPKNSGTHVYVYTPSGSPATSYVLTVGLENSNDSQASGGTYTINSAN